MKRPAFVIAARCALALLLTAGVRAARQTAGAPQFAELVSIAEAELREINAPGAAIAIVQGDRIVFQTGVGVANVETGQPVAADTVFRIGSVTKMFTTAVLVTLAEEGRLKVSDPIGNYVSGVNGKLARVSAHQLMSHTAGLKDEAPSYGPHDETALAATVRRWGDDYFFTDPGRIMSYSNPGMTLAGYVVEQVAKKPYATAIDERLFKPLGMTHTTFHPTIAMTWPLAQGHDGPARQPPAVVRPFADNSGYWPAGFMFSSAVDLARFTIAFMNDGQFEGHTVLRPAVIAALGTGYADVPSSADHARYGYGLTSSVHRGARLVQHGGAINGFGATVKMLPDHKGAVVVLVNRSGGQLEKTAERALEGLAPLQPAPSPPPTLAIDPLELPKYAGSYANGAARVDLIARQGKLYLKRIAPAVGPESEASRIGDLRFSMPAAAGGRAQEFALVPGADGQIAFLHIGSRALRRLPGRAS